MKRNREKISTQDFNQISYFDSCQGLQLSKKPEELQSWVERAFEYDLSSLYYPHLYIIDLEDIDDLIIWEEMKFCYGIHYLTEHNTAWNNHKYVVAIEEGD